MKKRFLAALLSLCMTLTLLPTTAFAAVSDSMGNTPEENQAILEQVSALTGDSSDQVLSMPPACGCLSCRACRGSDPVHGPSVPACPKGGDASAPPSIFPISLLSLPSFIFFAKIEFLH